MKANAALLARSLIHSSVTGDFRLPIEAECISVAEGTVMEFLLQLLAVLYRSDKGPPALTNRLEVLR